MRLLAEEPTRRDWACVPTALGGRQRASAGVASCFGQSFSCDEGPHAGLSGREEPATARKGRR